jgi:hypothetical protein
MKRVALALAVVGALVIAVPAATANDSSVGTQGAAIRPLADTDIRMDSEAVQIICMRDYALYRIDFKFVNESDTEKAIKLGFPFPDFENTEDGNRGDSPAAFGAWLNGAELEVKQERGFDTDGEAEWPVVWFTREAVFPPGESMVTVSYIGSPDSSVMGSHIYEALSLPPDSPGIVGYYPYLVHTGAGWAGPIGTTVVRYVLADDFNGSRVDDVMEAEASAEWVTPERARHFRSFTKPAPNVYQWVYTDYEPTLDHDPRLAFLYESEWSPSFDPYTDTVASSWLALGDYQYPPYNIRDGRPSDAWAEAVDGPGIGEWIDIPFSETREVREVRVVPGYQKRSDLFLKYNRPSSLKIEFSDGTTVDLPLADAMGLQTFAVNARAESAKVTILGVYPGTNERDETYISEITFAEAAAPKFSTFEAVTGIAAPDAFEEPEPLAQLTDTSSGGPAAGDDMVAEPTAGEARTGLVVALALVVLGVAAAGAAVVLKRKAGQMASDGPGEPHGQA